jgi:hypothetical protein
VRSEQQALTLLKAILAASILSTAIHYTHNFVAVSSYPGPAGSFYTVTRVAIVVAWPLLTAIGLIGYRRYRERRYHEARVCLAVYSLTGLATMGHFHIWESPHPRLLLRHSLHGHAHCPGRARVRAVVGQRRGASRQERGRLAHRLGAQLL